MFRRFLLGGSTLFFGLLMCVPAFGQQHHLNRVYGQGVHAFNRGNYSEAERLLSDAINAGIDDPRAYYFRAFTKMRSGNGYSAQSDIQAGAQLEVDGYNGYDIGMSLQRVQGTHRLEFEKLRSESKLAAQQAKRRYQSQTTLGGGFGGSGNRNAGSAERTEIPQDLGMPSGDDPTDPFGEAEQPVPSDPFMDDKPAMAPEADSDDMSTGDDDDLFGSDDAGDAAPADDAGDDLFGPDDAGDAAPADDAGDDLFGPDDAGDAAPEDTPELPSGDGDAGDDLFGPDDAGDAAPSGDDELDDLFG